MEPHVPELLLPALSQQSIVVEVAAAAAWPEWVAPLISLAGVPLGAWMAHRFTKNQDRQRIRQEKLGEIFALCGELQKCSARYVDEFARALHINEDGNIECQPTSGEAARDLDDLKDRLDFLMQVHMPSRADFRKQQLGVLIDLGIEVALLGSRSPTDAVGVEKAHAELMTMRSQADLAMRMVKKAAIADAKSSLDIKS